MNPHPHVLRCRTELPGPHHVSIRIVPAHDRVVIAEAGALEAEPSLAGDVDRTVANSHVVQKSVHLAGPDLGAVRGVPSQETIVRDARHVYLTALDGHAEQEVCEGGPVLIDPHHRVHHLDRPEGKRIGDLWRSRRVVAAGEQKEHEQRPPGAVNGRCRRRSGVHGQPRCEGTRGCPRDPPSADGVPDAFGASPTLSENGARASSPVSHDHATIEDSLSSRATPFLCDRRRGCVPRNQSLTPTTALPEVRRQMQIWEWELGSLPGGASPGARALSRSDRELGQAG
jgi:hypothetical protein